MKKRIQQFQNYKKQLFDINHPTIPIDQTSKVKEYIEELLRLGNQVKNFAKEVGEPQIYELAGDCYSSAALSAEFRLDDPNRARRLYRYAEEMYQSAVSAPNNRRPSSFIDSVPYETNAKAMRRHANRARKNAAIYKITKDMDPIRKFLIRKTEIIQPIIMLLLSFILLIPSITTNAIGNSIIQINLGIVFFIIALIECYILIYKIKSVP